MGVFYSGKLNSEGRN